MKNTYKIEKLQKNIENIKKNERSQLWDQYLIDTFSFIINEKKIEEKFLFLNEAYSSLGVRNKKHFDKQCLKILSASINNCESFIQWFSQYTLKEEDKKEDKIFEICKQLKSGYVITKFIEHNLPHLSKDEYKEKVLGLASENLSVDENEKRDNFMYFFYLNKYISKKEAFTEIVKQKKISYFLEKKWFDTSEMNYELNKYIDECKEKSIKNNYLNIVLRVVKDDFFPIYKSQLDKLFEEENVESFSIFEIAGNEKKLNYVLNNLSLKDNTLTQLIDGNFIKNMNRPKADKPEFEEIFCSILERHKIKEFTANQLCVIMRRCYDTNRKELAKNLIDTMLQTSPLVFQEFKDKTNSGSVEVYPGKVMDFSKDGIKKFLLEQLYFSLQNTLPQATKTSNRRKI